MMTRLTGCALFFFIANLSGQQLFIHRPNTTDYLSVIDRPELNGKPNLLLFVSQDFGAYNPREIGVWYNSAQRWTIYNQDIQPMPAGARFHVLAVDPAIESRAFVVTTTASNTAAHILNLDNPLCNNQPNACLLVTQHYGAYNTSPVGVWYNSGRWKIYNENRSPMPIGTKFNVLILSEGQRDWTALGARSTVFQHKVNAGSSHLTTLQNAATDNNPESQVFATQRYLGAYNTSPIGVWYSTPRWTVFNQNTSAPLAQNVNFNIVAFSRTTTPNNTNPEDTEGTKLFVLTPRSAPARAWMYELREDDPLTCNLIREQVLECSFVNENNATTANCKVQNAAGRTVYQLASGLALVPGFNYFNLDLPGIIPGKRYSLEFSAGERNYTLHFKYVAP